MGLRIYRISADKKRGYDNYDEAVVIATSASGARLIHPDGSGKEPHEWGIGTALCTWVEPKDVKVEHVGMAAAGKKADTVVCASFMAA